MDSTQYFFIKNIMKGDSKRILLVKQGIEHVKTHHSIDPFVKNLRIEIIQATA